MGKRDIKLKKFDSKTGIATYIGSVAITENASISDFGLEVGLPLNGNDQYTIQLRSGNLCTGDTFESARKRYALWLRNIADLLEGEEAHSLPTTLIRTDTSSVSKDDPRFPFKGGDRVMYKGTLATFERYSDDEKGKIQGTYQNFVALSDLVSVPEGAVEVNLDIMGTTDTFDGITLKTKNILPENTLIAIGDEVHGGLYLIESTGVDGHYRMIQLG